MSKNSLREKFQCLREFRLLSLVVIVPVFQHGRELANTISKLEAYNLPLIVVNDGSNAKETKIIRKACEREWVDLYERKENGGKGKAVVDGLELAKKNGFVYAFQIDADGQHDLSEIPRFCEVCKLNPESLVLGHPLFDTSVPGSRKAGRWMTHIWVWINSLSFRVKDSMCGFRIYPISPVLDIIQRSNIGYHMEFDVEICVRSCWADLPVVNLPVRVVYPEGGRSNFRLKEDNILLSLMHVRLFFGMLFRSPMLVTNRICSFLKRQN